MKEGCWGSRDGEDSSVRAFLSTFERIKIIQIKERVKTALTIFRPDADSTDIPQMFRKNFLKRMGIDLFLCAQYSTLTASG